MRSEMKMVAVLAALIAGCAERTAGAADAARDGKETAVTDRAAEGEEGVRGLPSSFGRSFATLDDYLAHLRQYAGPIDLPWYREVRPGVYERVTTIRPAPPTETYTREELMRKYGFAR